MPDNTVYVGRPSEFGNPYRVGDLSLDSKYPVTPAQAVGFFSFLIRHDYTYRDKVKEKLKGKDLACWCPLLDEDGEKFPCHADVLLEIANE